MEDVFETVSTDLFTYSARTSAYSLESVEAGKYYLEAYAPTIGFCAFPGGGFDVDIPLEASATAMLSSYAGGSTLAIAGKGLSENTEVRVCGLPAAFQEVNEEGEYEYETPAFVTTYSNE